MKSIALMTVLQSYHSSVLDIYHFRWSSCLKVIQEICCFHFKEIKVWSVWMLMSLVKVLVWRKFNKLVVPFLIWLDISMDEINTVYDGSNLVIIYDWHLRLLCNRDFTWWKLDAFSPYLGRKPWFALGLVMAVDVGIRQLSKNSMVLFLKLENCGF